MKHAAIKNYLSILVLLFMAIIVLFTTGCSQATPAPSQTEQPIAPASSNQSTFSWSIQVKKIEYTQKMSASQNMLQYSGNTTTVNIEKKPSDGHVFALADIEIDKQSSNGSQFDWKSLYILDGSGNKFYRMDNDTFLMDFHYNRIKSVSLTLGNNEGYACFEINKESQSGSLTLVYDAPEGQNRITLK